MFTEFSQYSPESSFGLAYVYLGTVVPILKPDADCSDPQESIVYYVIRDRVGRGLAVKIQERCWNSRKHVFEL